MLYIFLWHLSGIFLWSNNLYILLRQVCTEALTMYVVMKGLRINVHVCLKNVEVKYVLFFKDHQTCLKPPV